MQISALQALVETSQKFLFLAQRAALLHAESKTAELTAVSLQMRQVRHDYNAAKAAAGDSPPRIQNLVEVMDTIKNNMMASYEGEKILTEWKARPFDRAQLPTTLEEAATRVDCTLPLSWNFREDAVIFLGSGLPLVEECLVSLGQTRILRISPEDSENIYQRLREYRPRQPLNTYVYSAGQQIPDVLAARIHDALRDNKVFANTVNAFAEKWVAHGIPNLNVIAKHKPIFQLGGFAKDRPFLLIAPGPSLDKNIHLARRMQDKAIVCTVSHALKICQANGVRVDFCLTVDSQNLGYHFDGCDTANVGALVTGITCDPKIFSLPARHHIYMGANAAADSWILDGVDEFSVIPAGGSVATTAVAMAINLRCSPIIAIGLDCAMANDGKMYAQDSHDSDVYAIEKDGKLAIGGWSKQAAEMMKQPDYDKPQEQDAFTLPGYYGGEVHTTYILKMFHSWFASIAYHAGKLHKFVNCTEGGANIPNWENMPLAEAIEKFCDPLVPLPYWKGIDWQMERDDKSERLPKLQKRRKELAYGAKKIHQTAGRALACLDAGDSTGLEKQENFLLGHLQKAPVLSLLMQHPLHAALDRAYAATDPHVVMLAEKEYLLTVRRAAEYLLKHLHGGAK